MITVHQAGRIAEFMVGLHADVYPEGESNIHQEITRKAVALVSEHAPPKSRVLDVGCGRGYAEKIFREAGYNVHATTLCIEELNFSRTFADQNALPFGWTDYFDCVFARHVLEHSPIPFFTLHEFKRCLKDGGILYLEMPSPDTACNHEANANHYSVLGQRAWHLLISRAGFEVLKAMRWGIETQAGQDAYFGFLCRK